MYLAICVLPNPKDSNYHYHIDQKTYNFSTQKWLGQSFPGNINYHRCLKNSDIVIFGIRSRVSLDQQLLELFSRFAPDKSCLHKSGIIKLNVAQFILKHQPQFWKLENMPISKLAFIPSKPSKKCGHFYLNKKLLKFWIIIFMILGIKLQFFYLQILSDV